MVDEYPICRLGAVASVQGGFAFKSGDFTDTGVPVLKIKNVRLREVDTTEPAYVDQLVAKDSARYFCKTGDLLISMTGSGPQAPNSVVGRVARFTGPSDKYLINQRVGRFVNKAPDKLDQRYLFYVMAQDETLWKLVSIATGSANQANISGSQIESIDVPLPPLAEQKAIAAVLGALDDKIELNRRMNATLEAMARALFQSWFVDFDPVRATLDGRKPIGLDEATATLFPATFQDSSLGPIPHGWDARALAGVVDVVKGRSYRSEELVESRTALVTLKSFLRGGGYRTDGLKPFTGEYKANQRVCPGDLVVAFTDVTQAADVIGKPALVRSDDRFETLVASLDVGIVRPKSKHASIPFLYCLFLTAEFQAHTYSHATGTTVLHLGSTAIPSFVSIIPPVDIAEAFAERADPIFRLIDENAKQSRTLATLRDTLLPKLLSGELSLAQFKQGDEHAVSSLTA